MRPPVTLSRFENGVVAHDAIWLEVFSIVSYNHAELDSFITTTYMPILYIENDQTNEPHFLESWATERADDGEMLICVVLTTRPNRYFAYVFRRMFGDDWADQDKLPVDRKQISQRPHSRVVPSSRPPNGGIIASGTFSYN